MTRLFFNIWPFTKTEILPKSISQKFPKWVHNFAKYQINLSNVAKDLEIFANLAKFRQIWSLWLKYCKKRFTGLILECIGPTLKQQKLRIDAVGRPMLKM